MKLGIDHRTGRKSDLLTNVTPLIFEPEDLFSSGTSIIDRATTITA